MFYFSVTFIKRCPPLCVWLDEDYVLKLLCKRARGARTRTFTVSARGLRIEMNGLLARVLRRLEEATGAKIVVARLSNGRRSKYVVDAWALRSACGALC